MCEDLRDKSSGWELMKEDALVREGNRRQKETVVDRWGGVWWVMSLTINLQQKVCVRKQGGELWKIVWLHFMQGIEEVMFYPLVNRDSWCLLTWIILPCEK